MDINLGMHVYSSDDQDIGTVDKLILDPNTDAVKAAVVRKGVLLHRDVEVPTEMLTAGPDGNARIAYSSDEVDRLPRFEDANYAIPPVEYLPPSGYPLGEVIWPVGYGMAVPLLEVPLVVGPAEASWTGDSAVDQEIGAALRNQDLENAVIDKGSDVLDRDGEKVGTVHELSFDPTTSELTGLVVHKGLIMGKDTEVPASLIDKVDDGVVYLKVDASDVVK